MSMQIGHIPDSHVEGYEIGHLVRAVRRYMTRYSSAAQSCLKLTSPIELNGDFEIELQFSSTFNSSSPYPTLFSSDDSSDGLLFFVIRDTGDLGIQFGKSGVYTYLTGAATTANDGRLHTAKIRYITSTDTYYLSVDDGPEVSRVEPGINNTIAFWGVRRQGGSSGEYFDKGYIKDIKVKIAGETAIDGPLDGPPGADYEENKVAEFGSELVVNSRFDNDLSGWSDNSSAGGSIAWLDGEAQLINTTGTSRIKQNVATDVGAVYKIEATNTGIVNASYEFGDEFGSVLAGETLVYFYTATSPTTDIQFKNFYAGTTITMSAVSIKQIPSTTPCFIRYNFADEQTRLFTKDSVYKRWLGVEIITKNVWENPHSIGTHWSFVNNQWSYVGDGTYNHLQLLPTSSLPEIARLTGNISALSGGAMEYSASGHTPDITETGRYLFDFELDEAGSFIYKRGFGSVIATFNRPSLREQLKEA